jgi:hypothetical protein
MESERKVRQAFNNNPQEIEEESNKKQLLYQCTNRYKKMQN